MSLPVAQHKVLKEIQRNNTDQAKSLTGFYPSTNSFAPFALAILCKISTDSFRTNIQCNIIKNARKLTSMALGVVSANFLEHFGCVYVIICLRRGADLNMAN